MIQSAGTWGHNFKGDISGLCASVFTAQCCPTDLLSYTLCYCTPLSSQACHVTPCMCYVATLWWCDLEGHWEKGHWENPHRHWLPESQRPEVRSFLRFKIEISFSLSLLEWECPIGRTYCVLCHWLTVGEQFVCLWWRWHLDDALDLTSELLLQWAKTSEMEWIYLNVWTWILVTRNRT